MLQQCPGLLMFKQWLSHIIPLSWNLSNFRNSDRKFKAMLTFKSVNWKSDKWWLSKARERFWINTKGTTSSNLFIRSWSICAASSWVVSFAAEAWEDSAPKSAAAVVKRFDCTNHWGCGGSGSTVRCPSKR